VSDISGVPRDEVMHAHQASHDSDHQ